MIEPNLFDQLKQVTVVGIRLNDQVLESFR